MLEKLPRPTYTWLGAGALIVQWETSGDNNRSRIQPGQALFTAKNLLLSLPGYGTMHPTCIFPDAALEVSLWSAP
jgi:hypothetical protein